MGTAGGLGASAGAVSVSTGAFVFLAARVTSATRERPTRGRHGTAVRGGHWVRTSARADATGATPLTATVMDAR
mgnify:FL=1